MAAEGIVAASGAGTGHDPLAATADALAAVEARLAGTTPDLAVLFLGAAYADAVELISERVRETLAHPLLVGMTAGAVVAGGSELEHVQCLSLWAARLPDGARLSPLRLPPPAAGSRVAQWELPDDRTEVLLALVDPFTFPADGFLKGIAAARPGVRVVGGLASGARAAGQNRLVLGGGVHHDGAVAVALGGDVRLRTVVSQGCRPVGGSFTVTRAERNVIQELGGQTTADRLREAYADADPRDQALMRQGLHLGIVIDEYQSDFSRGDFLVRSVLGTDPTSGGVAVGDVVDVGQTVQFQVRDARSAHDDLDGLLRRLAADGMPDAALLFTCNGRGSRLFEVPDHDAQLVRELLDGPAVAGSFCAGEIGPVGGANHLHGFTASLLAFG